MPDPSVQVDDAELLLRVAVDKDQEALKVFAVRHKDMVYGWLIKNHGRQLADEAFYRALWNLWRFAERYDDKRPAGPWFLRIAQNAALSIIRGENRQQHAVLSEHDGYDPADCGPGGEAEFTESDKENQRKREHRGRDVTAIVEKLPSQQRAVTRADMAHPTGTAPAAELAAALGTSKNSVYVSRNNARATVRREMIRLGHYQEGDGGRTHAR